MFTFANIKSKSVGSEIGLEDDAYQPLLAIWAIKLAISCGWYKKNRLPNKLPDIFQEDDFCKLTGIVAPVEVDSEGDAKYISESYTKLSDAKLLKLCERRLIDLIDNYVPKNPPLISNVELIGNTIGLNSTERKLLVFATALTYIPDFRDVIGSRNFKVSTSLFARKVAGLLSVPVNELLDALREDAPLALTGMLEIEKSSTDMERKIEVPDRLAELLTLKESNEAELIKHFLKEAAAPSLELSDYPHLMTDIQALTHFLSNASNKNESGVNILFYGEPGTGKTELVKALAKSLNIKLYEVAYTDEDGDAVDGEQRLKAFNLCQKLLARMPNAMLMFDEVEDVFEKRDIFAMLFGSGSRTEKGKAWINRSMENCTVPAIWITNDEQIDPAYLRRFDYSVRFPIPPQKVRQQIARKHLEQFNPAENWLARIAANDQVSPGQIERAAKVARIAYGDDTSKAQQLVEQTLDRSITLLGQKRVPSQNVLRTEYDIGLINTDLPITHLVDAMKTNPSGTFCFYGPPGTGKTELARHMAYEIGKPLLLRRASDILSKWVGGSEKNIANMFAEARQQDAVLVLDEADSFLTDRRDAEQSWEVTQVNELLTQMEAFDGIFICTTNLMEKLDQASLRRFAFKIKFDYLTADQRWKMFVQELTRMGGDESNASAWEAPIRKMEKLTPGDFAVAARQFDIFKTPATAERLYKILQEECKVKGGAMGKIGFMA